MYVGEKIKLYIFSELVYGVQSLSLVILVNLVLVFDMELFGIKDLFKLDVEFEVGVVVQFEVKVDVKK